MELAVGRAGRGSAGMAYKALEPKGSKWHLHGWVCMAGCALLMMYYTTVTGWMVDYFVRFLTGGFEGAGDVEAVFNSALANPGNRCCGWRSSRRPAFWYAPRGCRAAWSASANG